MVRRSDENLGWVVKLYFPQSSSFIISAPSPPFMIRGQVHRPLDAVAVVSQKVVGYESFDVDSTVIIVDNALGQREIVVGCTVCTIFGE